MIFPKPDLLWFFLDRTQSKSISELSRRNGVHFPAMKRYCSHWHYFFTGIRFSSIFLATDFYFFLLNGNWYCHLSITKCNRIAIVHAWQKEQKGGLQVAMIAMTKAMTNAPKANLKSLQNVCGREKLEQKDNGKCTENSHMQTLYHQHACLWIHRGKESNMDNFCVIEASSNILGRRKTALACIAPGFGNESFYPFHFLLLLLHFLRTQWGIRFQLDVPFWYKNFVWSGKLKSKGRLWVQKVANKMGFMEGVLIQVVISNSWLEVIHYKASWLKFIPVQIILILMFFCLDCPETWHLVTVIGS